MSPFREYRRRSVIPLFGLALLVYYVLFYLPLAHRADSLDEPLQKAWRKLALSMDQTNATTLDLSRLTNQLYETRQALALVESTRKQAATRLDLSPELKTKMNAPFQLVDYQNERSKQIEEFQKQAKDQKITLDPAVFAGFPEHTIDTVDPALLWPALAFTDDLLASAIRCKVTAIHWLDVPVAMTNAPGTETAGRWDALPLQVEFTASADSAAQLIQSLPLRAEEIRAAGLPGPLADDKLPLFIDRLIIKKQSPEKLDEVRVWLQAIGFVLRE